jgi:hypothetical protein
MPQSVGWQFIGHIVRTICEGEWVTIDALFARDRKRVWPSYQQGAGYQQGEIVLMSPFYVSDLCHGGFVCRDDGSTIRLESAFMHTPGPPPVSQSRAVR